MKYFNILFILLSFNAFSFVDVESYRGKNSLGVELGGNHVENNNIENLDLMGGFIFNKIINKKEFLFVSDYVYSKVDDEATQDDFSVHGRYSIESGKIKEFETQWESFLQYERNEFSIITNRKLIGLGKRFVKEIKEGKLVLGLGIMNEEINLGSFNRFSAYFHSDYKLMNISMYYQPEVDNFNNYNFIFKAGLTLIKGEESNFSINYGYRGNNLTKELERTTLFKISYFPK